MNPKLEASRSLIEGRGIHARKPIEKGELLTKSVGRIVDRDTYLREVVQYGWDLGYNLDADHWLIPLDSANPSADWLMNHSCDPTGVQTSDDNIIARRDVKPGEEITYDYATTEEDPEWRMWCRCGSQNCRGVITGNDWKLPEVQEKYAGHFTASIARKIAAMQVDRDGKLDR
ncbi:SET domain-containing protein [Candidatus Parcubacteria bacterium]|nr:SET domain-containing protein [Candidatus Parcubacteria bacterium]